MRNYWFFVMFAQLLGIEVGVLVYTTLPGLPLSTAIISGLVTITGMMALGFAIRFGVWGHGS